jgi:phosphosulfolactate synthase (CoM biosynthesis protein A)
MKDEALHLALESFNKLAAWNDGEVGSHMDEPYSAEVAREAITAIKAALEAKDEIVEWKMGVSGIGGTGVIVQPQRTWIGLTDEEVDQFHNWKDCTWSTNELVRYVEAKLRSKND